MGSIGDRFEICPQYSPSLCSKSTRKGETCQARTAASAARYAVIVPVLAYFLI